MTTWYVHRREGGSIASAHAELQPGYATEALDDAGSAELQAFLSPPATVAETLAAKLAAGYAITSTGTPAISATYGLDATTQNDFVGVATAISLLGTFPGGGSTFSYPDLSGAPVTFGDVSAFKSVFGALSAHVLALRQTAAVLDAGGTAEWPAAAVTIP